MANQVQTKLILNQDLPEGEKIMYEKIHQGLDPLGKNQLNIYGVIIEEEEDRLFVKTIIRTTLETPITFKKGVNIALFADDQELLVKQSFNLAEIQPLQPNCAYPYTFSFAKNQLIREDYSLKSSWRITFQLPGKKHELDLSDSQISEKAVDELQRVMDHVGPPRSGEVNILSLSIKKLASGDLQTTALIRNGTKQVLDIKQLPMQVLTAEGNVIAKGSFSLEHLTVRPNTSKPATFVFPKKSIRIKDFNPRNCKIEAVQK